MNSLEKERSHTIAPIGAPFAPDMLDSDWDLASVGLYDLINASLSEHKTIYIQSRPSTLWDANTINVGSLKLVSPKNSAIIQQTAQATIEAAFSQIVEQTSQSLSYAGGQGSDLISAAIKDVWSQEQIAPRMGSISARPFSRPTPLKRKAVLDDIVRELGRLDNGWAGDGSVRPKNSIILDIQRFAISLPPGTIEPEAEVDEEDGYVSLRWTASKLKSSLTILFLGERNIILTYSSLINPESPSKKMKVDTVELASALNQPEFLAVLTEHGMQ